MGARIKFCGLTRAADVTAALALGVDALGFNLAKGPRRIPLEHARTLTTLVGPLVVTVALFVDAAEEEILEAMRRTRCQVAQLHGAESNDLVTRLRARFPVIKAVTLRAPGDLAALHGHPADALLLDGAQGGSGQTWDLALSEGAPFDRPIILAGGLRPETVGAAITRVKPMGVDVASGIESQPGVKDPSRMAAFVRAVRDCGI